MCTYFFGLLSDSIFECLLRVSNILKMQKVVPTCKTNFNSQRTTKSHNAFCCIVARKEFLVTKRSPEWRWRLLSVCLLVSKIALTFKMLLFGNSTFTVFSPLYSALSKLTTRPDCVFAHAESSSASCFIAEHSLLNVYAALRK